MHQVLVHAGTGGVGLAAINIATALKCPIFATAGSTRKRALLRSLGVQAVASSRDAIFLDTMGYRAGMPPLPPSVPDMACNQRM